MAGGIQRAGEGELLFGGRILVKADHEQLCVTESLYVGARDGAEPHYHERHADTFYVLEGELAFLVHDEEHRLGPGACVSAPRGVVHGFRSLETSRFLNFHTPDSGFAENLRARDRGEPGSFDNVDVPPGAGLPPTDAVLLGAGEGEALSGVNRVATIKVGCDELALIEFELEPGYEGPPLHTHEDHVDAFYVIEGEAIFEAAGERALLGPGSFVSASPGMEHTFTGGPGPSRLLNLHAPSAGFHDWLRSLSSE